MPEPGTHKAYAYTDGASTGSRGPGGYGTVLTWEGNTDEVSGGERDTTNLRMEVPAPCVALETIDKVHAVIVHSDCSYLVNCMRRGWYKKWRENACSTTAMSRWRTETYGRGSWKQNSATGPTNSPWPPEGRQRDRQHRRHFDANGSCKITLKRPSSEPHLQ